MAATYNPKDVSLIYGGALIQGFAEGSFVNVEYNVESVALLVGADGKATRSTNPNNSARITVRLLPTSASNLIFQAALSADRAGGFGQLPLLLTVLSVGQNYAAEGAWVVRSPGYDFQVEAQAVEWMLESDDLIGAVLGT